MGKARVGKSTPKHPYISSFDGPVPLTEDDSPFRQLDWIKTTTKTFKDSFDEIVQMRQHIATTPQTTPPLRKGLCETLGTEYLDEQQRISHIYFTSLSEYHKIKTILQYKVEQYLPELRIPLLRDDSLGWFFPSQKMPDRSQFMAEMDEIYHHANLRQRQEAKTIIQSTQSAPPSSAKRKSTGKRSGRPRVDDPTELKYQQWCEGYKKRTRGEKKLAYCIHIGIKVKELNAAQQHLRRKRVKTKRNKNNA